MCYEYYTIEIRDLFELKTIKEDNARKLFLFHLTFYYESKALSISVFGFAFSVYGDRISLWRHRNFRSC